MHVEKRPKNYADVVLGTLYPIFGFSFAESDVSGSSHSTLGNFMRILQVVLVVVEHKSRFLAVSRKDDPQDFGFPGGKLEPGESFVQAAKRELLEETGYEVSHLEYLTCLSYEDRKVHYFKGHDISFLSSPTESGKVNWISAKEMTRQRSFGEQNSKFLEYYEARTRSIHDI